MPKILLTRNFSMVYKTITKTVDSTSATYLMDTKGQFLSYWEDIPTTNSDLPNINAVIEIPKFNFRKNQLNKEKAYHPIEQDLRKINNVAVPRFYQQTLLFNYGYIPQTWENSNKLYKIEGEELKGDGDPIDVIEISGRSIDDYIPHSCVVLGAYALVDQNELDWKIIAINEEDSYNEGISNLEELVKRKPHLLEYIKNWFLRSKSLEGKKMNRYLFEGRLLEQDIALEIINDARNEYKLLKTLKEYADLQRLYHL